MVKIYNLGIWLYYIAIRLVSLWNVKAKKWLKGRENWQQKVQESLAKGNETQGQNQSVQTIWMHVASLGEFEQGRPVLEALREQYPKHRMVLSFFSPSGYEIRKNYPHADHVFYLPLDTQKNARQWLQLLQPELAIFVKYDFWYHYLHELHLAKINTIVIAALFRPNQVFFKWYGSFFRRMLANINAIFVQNEASKQLLEGIGLGEKQVQIAKDTRFDRVFANSQTVQPLPLIAQFKGKRRLFVVGSSWQADEFILLPLLHQTSEELCFVIAPHEIKANKITAFQQQIQLPSLRYSTISSNSTLTSAQQAAKVLIVDRIGLLAAIYQYADYAYIGGGFGIGIHNTQEAAIFGMPIFIGPKYEKFKEAVDLVTLGSYQVVQSGAELVAALKNTHLPPERYEQISQLNRHYMLNNCGGTETIMEFVKALDF